MLKTVLLINKFPSKNGFEYMNLLLNMSDDSCTTNKISAEKAYKLAEKCIRKETIDTITTLYEISCDFYTNASGY